MGARKHEVRWNFRSIKTLLSILNLLVWKGQVAIEVLLNELLGNRHESRSKFIEWSVKEVISHSPFEVTVTIFPIFHAFEWNISQLFCEFTCNRLNYWNWAWTGFHNSELKWNVILWNAKHWFRMWIFRKCEFLKTWYFLLWPTLFQIQIALLEIYFSTKQKRLCQNCNIKMNIIMKKFQVGKWK